MLLHVSSSSMRSYPLGDGRGHVDACSLGGLLSCSLNDANELFAASSITAFVFLTSLKKCLLVLCACATCCAVQAPSMLLLGRTRRRHQSWRKEFMVAKRQSRRRHNSLAGRIADSDSILR